MNIGQRIKTLRVKNGLTQEELASRCELTKGFLSQLENGLTDPSLPTLTDIVNALGTDMSTFFKEEKEGQIVFKKDDCSVDEREDMSIRWLISNAQKNQMEPIIIELQPNASSNVLVPQEGEEFGYVLTGCVHLINGEEDFVVEAGDSFYIKCDKENYLINKTSRVAKVLWVTNPPMF